MSPYSGTPKTLRILVKRAAMFRLVRTVGAPPVAGALIVEPLVYVHADSQVARALREGIGAGAFVSVTTIGIVVPSELLDRNGIFRDRQRRSHHHHPAGFDDFIVYMPAVQSEHVVQPL